jgi:hypothetical protein
MITALDQLTPEAAAEAQRLLDAAVAGVGSTLHDEIRLSMATHLCELLDAEATPADVAEAMDQLGVVEAPFGERGFADWLDDSGIGDLAGRVARTWWNPADARLFLPRAVGVGWDLNFGAVAVGLGLIEPDAEAVPFTATPDAAFKAAAAVPLTLGAAVGLHYIVRGRSLPARLPSHWALDGRPDRWVSKGSAAVNDLAITSLAAGAAAWAATSKAEGPQRAGVLAGATLAGGLAATTAVVRGLAKPRGWAAPLGVLAASAAVAGVLFGLAKAGRDAEIARDLGDVG